MLGCEYPTIKGVSGFRNGCRCDRCVLQMKDAAKQYRMAHPNECAERRKKHYSNNKEYFKNRKLQLKIETLIAYGGLICKCCKETTLEFLTLDHIFNDGYLDHPFIDGKRTYKDAYYILKNTGFPNKDRYQVLCMNCNFGKRLNNGICPHKLTTQN